MYLNLWSMFNVVCLPNFLATTCSCCSWPVKFPDKSIFTIADGFAHRDSCRAQGLWWVSYLCFWFYIDSYIRMDASSWELALPKWHTRLNVFENVHMQSLPRGSVDSSLPRGFRHHSGHWWNQCFLTDGFPFITSKEVLVYFLHMAVYCILMISYDYDV